MYNQSLIKLDISSDLYESKLKIPSVYSQSPFQSVLAGPLPAKTFTETFWTIL